MLDFHKGDMSIESMRREVERLKKFNEVTDLSKLTPKEKTEEEKLDERSRNHAILLGAKHTPRRKRRNGLPKGKSGSPYKIVEEDKVFQSAHDLAAYLEVKVERVYRHSCRKKKLKGHTIVRLKHLDDRVVL
jgi:hypothetical protein